MKKTIYNLIVMMGVVSCACSALADMDPFSVYKTRAPEGCLNPKMEDQALVLSDLIEIGICTNPTLNREFMSVKTAEASLGEARSEYLPNVDATAQIQLNASKTEGASTNQKEPYSGNLGLSWLLYDFGGRSARVDKTKAYLDRAEFNYNAQLQETILQITRAYLNLLGSQESLKSAQSSEKSYKKALEESTKRFELGLVALSDKLQAKTSYEQSRLAVVQAKNAVRLNQGNLAILLNMSPNTKFNLEAPKKDKKVTDLETKDSVEKLMDLALEQRPEIHQELSDITAAKENITSVRSSTLPKFSTTASAGYNDNWKNDNPYDYNTSVGLKMTVPLFTGFSDTYRMSQARFQHQQAELSLVAMRDMIRNEVWAGYQNYKTSVEAYKISQQILASAVENERVAFKSYEVGKVDILNLLTANSQLEEARQESVNAFYTVLVNKENLYRAIGRF